MYDVVLLLSGGIDSTSVLYRYKAQGLNVLCLTFDYGQTLIGEVTYARNNAERVGADFKLINAPMDWIAPGCALFHGDMPVDRSVDEIARNGTPPTYVPFRNGIMLAYAAAIAETQNIQTIACGGNGLSSGIYWDDTEQFRRAMQAAIRAGTAPRGNGTEYILEFPNAELTKAQVVQQGVAVGMVLDNTWSCYKNGPKPCGICDSCAQRQFAIKEAGL